MDVKELDRLLNLMCIQGGSDGEPIRIECNLCSAGDYLYSENAYAGDFEDVAKQLVAHLRKHHPDRIEAPFDPVTDDEIEEVFGLSQARTKHKQ